MTIFIQSTSDFTLINLRFYLVKGVDLHRITHSHFNGQTLNVLISQRINDSSEVVRKSETKEKTISGRRVNNKGYISKKRERDNPGFL